MHKNIMAVSVPEKVKIISIRTMCLQCLPAEWNIGVDVVGEAVCF